ncbi:pilus assembly protein [Cupriavidus sp. UYMSc13B]|nr:pilus assembly protein [Cupriavidus sp. UYMSc13B]
MQNQLEDWGKRAGWKVLWNVPDTWIVPGDKAYGSDFAAAAQAVIEDLAANGADVLLDAWKDNKTVVIHQGGQ